MTHDEKIKELLKILDLPEEEQAKWLRNKFCKGRYCIYSAAQYAFRLRDEIRKLDDDVLVASLALIYTKCSDVVDDTNDCLLWFIWNAQPIHWIIAALIAKELAK
jgi:hypothetical protein